MQLAYTGEGGSDVVQGELCTCSTAATGTWMLSLSLSFLLLLSVYMLMCSKV